LRTFTAIAGSSNLSQTLNDASKSCMQLNHHSKAVHYKQIAHQAKAQGFTCGTNMSI
jgi:hypothetical protein